MSTGKDLDLVRIAPADREDLPAVARLRGVMAVEMGNDWDGPHPGWQERFAEYFRGKIAMGHGQIFIARGGGAIVGMVAVTLVDDYHGFVRGRLSARVNSVYVVPELRRRGVARALMMAAIDWLRACGCTVVRLHSSVEAMEFYRSMGFTPRRELELVL